MNDIQETLQRWSSAQEQSDVGTLEELADSDFTLVGPLGFVLTKDQWLGQFRNGALVTHSITQDEMQIREYGDTAVAISAHTQEAEYSGTPANGKFRITQILVKTSGGWRMAGMHFSPITTPPQRP